MSETDRLRDLTRLEDILASIKNIREFRSNFTIEEFAKNNLVLSAVLYQFVVIGEASKNLSAEAKEKTEYKWHKPASFRNFIAHEYYRIELAEVYKTTFEPLDELERVVKQLQSVL